MQVTKDVILDLLPLYLADEVSADTRTLVEKYLETDSMLAQIAAESTEMLPPDDSPIPLTTEDQMIYVSPQSHLGHCDRLEPFHGLCPGWTGCFILDFCLIDWKIKTDTKKDPDCRVFF